MKYELKENQGIPAPLLALMAVAHAFTALSIRERGQDNKFKKQKHQVDPHSPRAPLFTHRTRTRSIAWKPRGN